MLKDRVIKPLLVATEKVVEYYFPEDTAEPATLDTQEAVKGSQKEIEGSTTKPGTESLCNSSQYD